MIIQKDRKFYKFTDKEKVFSESVYSWLAQYDEDDEFLSGKASKTLPEFTEEE